MQRVTVPGQDGQIPSVRLVRSADVTPTARKETDQYCVVDIPRVRRWPCLEYSALPEIEGSVGHYRSVNRKGANS